MGLNALRAVLSKSPIEQVLIYQGPGICQESVSGLKRVFSQLSLPWRVRGFVAAEGVLDPDPGEWERRRTLFILPGGTCSIWDRDLLPVVPKIRRCVEEGDFFLGICAGSYFAAKQSVYRWSVDDVGYFQRGLSLFSGRAVGPVFFNSTCVESYGVSWEPKTATQRWEGDGSELPVLVLGGPQYLPDGGGTKVLARLVDGEVPTDAVVKSVCELGTSILMNWCPGVTIPSEDLEAYQKYRPLFDWEKLVQPMNVQEARLTCFARILSEYQLTIEKPSL